MDRFVKSHIPRLSSVKDLDLNKVETMTKMLMSSIISDCTNDPKGLPEFLVSLAFTVENVKRFMPTSSGLTREQIDKLYDAATRHAQENSPILEITSDVSRSKNTKSAKRKIRR